MAIGVFIYPEELTADQYATMLAKLEEAGASNPAGRQHHFCFGGGDSLVLVEVWDSQEDFIAFAEVLGPVLEEMELEVEPSLLQLHNSISA